MKMVISAFDGLLDSLQGSVVNAKTEQTINNFTRRDLLLELVSMIVFGPLLVLWEASSSHESAEGNELLKNFQDAELGIGPKSSVPALVQTAIPTSKFYSTALVTVTFERITHMVDKAILKPDVRVIVASSFTKVRESIDMLHAIRDVRWWRWISIGNSIISFLYLLLSPFLLWFGQGKFMIATYPVIFLIVGGLVSYRWFISDIFLFPTDMHAKSVYVDMCIFATKADSVCQRFSDINSSRYSNIMFKYKLTSEYVSKTY
jgi:hypothetical protein